MLFFNPMDRLFCYEYDKWDYGICRYREIFYRGPWIDFDLPYMCCVGDSITFGRFASEPFPQQLSSLVGIQVINLGYGRISPTHIRLSPSLKEILSRSVHNVFQMRFNVDIVESLRCYAPCSFLDLYGHEVGGERYFNLDIKSRSNYYLDNEQHREVAVFLHSILGTLQHA
jgi:hypothetical protein